LARYRVGARPHRLQQLADRTAIAARLAQGLWAMVPRDHLAHARTNPMAQAAATHEQLRDISHESVVDRVPQSPKTTGPRFHGHETRLWTVATLRYSAQFRDFPGLYPSRDGRLTRHSGLCFAGRFCYRELSEQRWLGEFRVILVGKSRKI
jgi:hypothetical protein